jgi:hypothetical protein
VSRGEIRLIEIKRRTDEEIRAPNESAQERDAGPPRRGKKWFRYDAPDKQLFKQLQKTLTSSYVALD